MVAVWDVRLLPTLVGSPIEATSKLSSVTLSCSSLLPTLVGSPIEAIPIQIDNLSKVFLLPTLVGSPIEAVPRVPISSLARRGLLPTLVGSPIEAWSLSPRVTTRASYCRLWLAAPLKPERSMAIYLSCRTYCRLWLAAPLKLGASPILWTEDRKPYCRLWLAAPLKLKLAQAQWANANDLTADSGWQPH